VMVAGELVLSGSAQELANRDAVLASYLGHEMGVASKPTGC
jgi:hypothetical protein